MNKKILGKYYVFSTYTFLHLLLLHIFGEKYLSLTLRIIKLLGRLDEWKMGKVSFLCPIGSMHYI
jgi:hypothetical protein